jgi:phage shock protein PspC (stress-responsive transcriptional regulator)
MESQDQDPTTPQAGDPAGEPPTTETPAAEMPPGEAPPATGAAGDARPHEPPGDLPPTGAASAGGAAGGPRRLYRSRDDRMIAGVCGGLARYFGIDPVIVRVAAVALVFAGGAGLLAYLAAWLLVPDEAKGAEGGAGRTATVAGAVLLVFAVAAIVPFWGGPFGGADWGGPFVGLLCLGLVGLGVWWVASGEHPAGSARDVLRRAGMGLAILALCGLLAVGAAWATAVGGGTVVAVIVIVAGLWVAAGAFVGGTRWLILPALALALPAGVVSAANIDVKGGIGERQYRPAAATAIQPAYRLGIGRLVVDLRGAHLAAGDRRIDVELGVGLAIVAVDPGVCVMTHARIGAGEAGVFDRTAGGVDVDWADARTAPAGRPRVVIDANIGVGALYVGRADPDTVGENDFGPRSAGGGNDACVGGRNG